MSLKVLIFAAAVAAAQAGYIAPVSYGLASTAIGSSSQSTLRSADGSSAISQYSKAVDTAFSSVRKTDTRITNDARYITPVAAAYHAPAYASYAAPVVAKAYAPAISTYAAAPAISTYATAPVVAKAYAPALAAPAYAARTYAAPAVAAHGLLGVAYSAAPTVAHVSYDSPIVHYAL
ncbi:pupal cuticle protein G1A [Halyomorpha halys]|uniref:pupal cuticle protein G1A n=1 Tax=Halyomorpha halys TaxID=286706 RepID=UPI0034D2DC4B|nr:Cuticle Protein CPF [Halyomorpha halys]